MVVKEKHNNNYQLSNINIHDLNPPSFIVTTDYRKKRNSKMQESGMTIQTLEDDECFVFCNCLANVRVQKLYVELDVIFFFFSPSWNTTKKVQLMFNSIPVGIGLMRIQHLIKHWHPRFSLLQPNGTTKKYCVRNCMPFPINGHIVRIVRTSLKWAKLQSPKPLFKHTTLSHTYLLFIIII